MTAANVLIVDDEPNAVRVLSAILKADGYSVFESIDVEQAIDIVRQRNIDAIITDIKMPVRDGYELFDYINENHPHIPVMFLTAYGTVDSAVQAMSGGAVYYFIKPPDYQKLKTVLAQSIQQNAARTRLEAPPGGAAQGPANRYQLIGRSPAMQGILRLITQVRDTGSNILIHGETGTGKEVIAGNLHYLSVRREKPFVAVNCAAIPRELIESELFGSEKGAFTGAIASRTGKIEEASGGTLFLDEIGELEMPVQAKLLRVLQERTIERLGSNKKIAVDFRLISSTNRDLEHQMQVGTFRSDLYYRINVVRIEVPPLRDRKEDIPLLAEVFLQEFCAREKKPLTLSEDILEALRNYSWPGNIRQLKNVIEHAVIIAKGQRIAMRDLPSELRAYRVQRAEPAAMTLRAMELHAVNRALQECNGNKSEAARKLGISRKALYARLKELNRG
jgi:DNA-binding NtrC family response regulator